MRIQPGDTKGIENLAQSIIRNTFSLAKLSFVESSGTVIHRSKMSNGGNKKNFQTFSTLEFIAAITQHIPEWMSQMVRYLVWHSNRMGGDRLKAEKGAGENIEAASEIIIASGFKTKKVPPLMWRECIMKIWEVDSLLCHHCQIAAKMFSGKM